MTERITITKKKSRELVRLKSPAAFPNLVVRQLSFFLDTLDPYTKVHAYDVLPGEIDISELGLVPIPDDLQDAIDDPAEVYIVPMLGVNSLNYRLGRGGGFYDRLLKKVPSALVVGVTSESRRIEFLEEGHDVPMDIVITERGQH